MTCHITSHHNTTQHNTTQHNTNQHSTGRLLTCSADMMGMRKLMSHRGGAAGSDDSNAWKNMRKKKNEKGKEDKKKR